MVVFFKLLNTNINIRFRQLRDMMSNSRFERRALLHGVRLYLARCRFNLLASELFF